MIRATFDSLVADFTALPLPPAGPVLVHASLRQVGPVAGGAVTVLAALQHAIGPGGSVVVPTHTSNNSTTSPAFVAATAGLDSFAVARYVGGLDGFDVASTPSFGMGAFAEHVRRQPGARRSTHPQTSFAAVGVDAARLTRIHRLECHLGEDSPLGALYQADATVLLLGVDYRACTAFHLAEYRLPRPPTRAYRCFVRTAGRREQCDFVGVDLDDSDFPALGAEFATTVVDGVRPGTVGRSRAMVMPIRRLVDFAVGWFARHRRPLVPIDNFTYGEWPVATRR
jgi:aminoglycoside 3-N-acetyltransferase